MTTNFPTSVDAFTNPTSNDTLDNPPHDQQHADINDAMEAVQTSLLDGSPLKIDDANNRVGIGTTSPASPLEIADGSAGQIRFEPTPIAIGSNGDGYELNLVGGTPDSYTNAGGRIRLGGGTRGDGDVSNIIFMRDTTESMRIDSSGNVGIGTTSPSTKADIYTDAAAGVPYPLYLSAKNSAGTKKDYVQIGYGIEQGLAGLESGGFIVKTLQSGSVANALSFTGHASAQEWNVYTQGNSRLKIDSSGRVTAPQQPYFMATGASWSSIPTGGGAAAKPPNVTQRNMGSYGYSNTTGYFYPPVDGLYLIGYEVGCYSYGSNAAYWRVSMRYNGTGFHDALSNVSYISTGTHDFIATSHIIYLTVGNYVHVNVDTAYNLTSYGGEKFYGVLIA